MFLLMDTETESRNHSFDLQNRFRIRHRVGEKDILLLVTISEQQAAVSRVRTGVGVGWGAARR